MKATVLSLVVLAAFGISIPNASFTIFGAAELTARLHDTVRVGVAVEQADGGLSRVEMTIPHTDALEYAGVEVGAYGKLKAATACQCHHRIPADAHTGPRSSVCWNVCTIPLPWQSRRLA